MESRKRAARWTRLAVVAALVTCLGVVARGGQSPAPPRVGKVLVVRGLMTVFSLGLDDLATKLRNKGLDVSVVPASLSPAYVESMTSAYRRNPNHGPVVIIGHSLGASIAPDLARLFQKANIPVELVVTIDSTHENTIPANVRRCVNLYQSGEHGVLAAVPFSAESKSTDMNNIEVNNFQRRFRQQVDQSPIDHFNIESSPWIHELVISEVLEVCPPRPVAQRVARRR